MNNIKIADIYLNNNDNIISIFDDPSEITTDTREFFMVVIGKIKNSAVAGTLPVGYFQYDRYFVPLSNISAIVLSDDIVSIPLSAPRSHVSENDYKEKGRIDDDGPSAIVLKI